MIRVCLRFDPNPPVHEAARGLGSAVTSCGAGAESDNCGLCAPPTLVPAKHARLLAERNLEHNLAVLQPDSLREMIAATTLPEHSFALARDGTLTARLADRWLAGTGVPGRVADRLVASADVSRPVLGLVGPTHIQQVIKLLGRMGPSQVLVAIFLDAESLAFALRCADVTELISAHRLRLLCGPDVDRGVRDLFERDPGLAIPDRLFRPADADTDAAANLVQRAKLVLRQVRR